MRLLAILLVLGLGSGFARADSAAELDAAKSAFLEVQTGLTVRANRLDSELRAAIWAQYYLALERLQQMDVHQQMMARHKMDRTEQFEQARADFERAIDELKRLLPPGQGSE